MELKEKSMAMNDKDVALIPYMVYEDIADRYDKTQKRMLIVVILSMIMVIVMAVTLCFVHRSWLKAWSDYDYVSEETVERVIVDSGDGGNASYIGRDGGIINGEGNSYEDPEISVEDEEKR